MLNFERESLLNINTCLFFSLVFFQQRGIFISHIISRRSLTDQQQKEDFYLRKMFVT